MNEFNNNGYTPEPRGDEHTEHTEPQAEAKQEQAFVPHQAADPSQAPQNAAPPVSEEPPRTPY